MIKLSEIISFMEETYPLSYAEEFDNPGLLCGRSDREVSKALVCLDVTDAVVEEAIKLNCQLIISHHPVIFGEMKSITDETYLGKLLVKAIENNISIYSAHTNLDSAPNGLTDYIAKMLDLPVISNIENNLGRVLSAPKGFTAKMLIERIKAALGVERLYTTLTEDRVVRKIALCNGGGGDLVDAVARVGADIYISGDLKHHNVLNLKSYENLDYIEVRHHECEAPMKELVCNLLKEEFAGKLDVEIATSCKPVLIDAQKIL